MATATLPTPPQVLDVIIGWVSSNDADTITAGRSFYFYDEHNHYLGGGAEAWSGYSQVWKCVELCVHGAEGHHHYLGGGAEAWSGYSQV